MSSKKDINSEVDGLLGQSQSGLLEKIENLRSKIKFMSERELNKSLIPGRKKDKSGELIPIHVHTPGSTASAGVEDVAFGHVKQLAASEMKKVTPPDVSEKVVHDLKGQYGYSTPEQKAKVHATAWKIHNQKSEDSMKSEKCVKCGEMHEPINKCGEVMKSDLIDAKGNKSSNSVTTPFKDHGPDISEKGAGGIILPGSKLKKKSLTKALTAGMASGVPSTSVNQLGKAAVTVPAAKPPSGINMGTHVPKSKPGNLHSPAATGMPKPPQGAAKPPKMPGIFSKTMGKSIKKQP